MTYSKKRKKSISVRPAIFALMFMILGGWLILSSQAATSWAPVYTANFPDPSVLRHGSTYYGFATNSGGLNISSAVSSNQIAWTKSSTNALPNLPSWAYAGKTWAPSVVYNSTLGKYVMFYSVLKNTASPRPHCISIATATSPAGPYTDTSSGPLICQTSLGGSIDPDLFYDSDGKAYLYVKNAGDAGGFPDSLWVQPLNSSFNLQGSLTKMLNQDQSWQGRTIEGPAMLKLGGKYYLFYAGNSFSTDKYAIGYATCTSPIGPCSEGPHNPVLATTGSMLGPGSPAFYIDSAGKQKMVFHAYQDTVGGPRKMYEAVITLANSQPVIAPASTPTTPPPPPPPPPSPNPTPNPNPNPSPSPSPSPSPGTGHNSGHGSTTSGSSTTTGSSQSHGGTTTTTGGSSRTSPGGDTSTSGDQTGSTAGTPSTSIHSSLTRKIGNVIGWICIIASIVFIIVMARRILTQNRNK